MRPENGSLGLAAVRSCEFLLLIGCSLGDGRGCKIPRDFCEGSDLDETWSRFWAAIRAMKNRAEVRVFWNEEFGVEMYLTRQMMRGSQPQVAREKRGKRESNR
jgi:hypothetical protein